MESTPKTLQEAIIYFSDYDNCRQFMESVRWLDGVVRCPICGNDGVTYLKNAKVYKCKVPHAKQKFSLKTGTVFEDSPIPLQKWLPALWLLVSCKNGISSYELHRDLKVTQKTAWFMLHRIRTALKTASWMGRLGGEGFGPVEVDETFVGGKLANMHKDKKLRYQKRGGAVGKTIVQGYLDRDLRQMRTKIIPNIKRETLTNRVLEEVNHGSKVYTDDNVSYDRLFNTFVHEVVNKTQSYVRGQVHVNGVENFWSLLKRTLKGTYIAVEPYHLERYLDEQVFRFNNRTTKDNPLDDSDRFHLALAQIVGKRLTYSELTGKEGEAAF
jgi:transposase-like protein